MKKLYLICLYCFFTSNYLWAQEQLTDQKSVYGSDSFPLFLGQVNGKTIFTAYSAQVGTEIWATDGTSAGTYLIKDIISGINRPSNTPPTPAVAVKNGYLYFASSQLNSNQNAEIWRTDGTSAGTTKVLDAILSKADSVQLNISFAYDYLPFQLLNSDDNFFIKISYQGITLVKRYDAQFRLVNSTLYNNQANINVYQNEIYFNNPISDNGILFNNQDNFGIGDTFYQTYLSNTITQLTSDWGRIKVTKNRQSAQYALPIVPEQNQNFSGASFFVYQNKLHFWFMANSFDAITQQTQVMGYLYTFDPVNGFQLKKNIVVLDAGYTYAQQVILRPDNHLMHMGFLLNDTFKHISLNLDTYLLKEEIKAENIAQVIKGSDELYWLRYKTPENGRKLYSLKNKKIVSLNYPILPSYLQAEISNDLWLFSGNINNGYEPYTLNSNTGNISLLKDINDVGYGIRRIDTLNKRVIWGISQEAGFHLYTSDGTKNSLKQLLKVTDNFMDNPIITRYNDELIYGFKIDSYGTNNYCCNGYAFRYVVTDGVAKAIKLYDNNTPLLASAMYKIGSNYYHIFAKAYKAITLDSLFIVKYAENGTQETTQRISLNTSGDIGTPVTLSVLENRYIKVMLPYYMGIELNNTLIIDLETNTRIDSRELKYLDELKGKLIFRKNLTQTNTSDIYVLRDNTPVKIIENIQNTFNYLRLSKQFIFYTTKGIWVYDTENDLTTRYTLDATQVPEAIIQYQELEGGLLIQGLKYTPDRQVAGYEYKFFKNGVIREVQLPANSNFSINQGINLKITDKSYFLLKSFSETYTMIYVFDTESFRLIDSMKTTNSLPVYTNNDGLFYEYNNNFYFWSPAQGSKLLLTGYISFSKISQWGNTTIFSAYLANDGVQMALFMSDGTPTGSKRLNLTALPKSFEVVFEYKGKIYIRGTTPETSSQFWETNGTPEGTKRISEFNKKVVFANYFMVVNDIPVCLISLQDSGSQLFSLKPTLSAPLLAIPSSQACEGDEIVLTAPKGFDKYRWLIDKTEQAATANNTFNARKTGIYQVIVEQATISSLPSNAANIRFVPLPEKPVITQAGNALVVSTNAPTLQWYINSTAIADATQKTLNYGTNGSYTVKVTANNCSTVSEAFVLNITALEEQGVSARFYPNPSSTRLVLERSNNSKALEIVLTDIKGRIIIKETTQNTRHELDVSNINRGLYLLTINGQTQKVIIE
ncbi:T9SS type A sorting domain-containing protein [Emticicia sp. 17c]|uniref:T9SS type A sorting domain-containing protein n=1 Tax=Emticicia sp. 17c TaxID=3127704 RepID=UPI00301DB666